MTGANQGAVHRINHGPIVPQIEQALREQLRERRWAPGQKLPNESALAAELGVGRSSVREAVRLLARDGLLEVRHGSGTFVLEQAKNEPDVGELLRKARLLEVYEVRRGIEVEAARLASARARPGELGAVRDKLAERNQAGDAARYVDSDLEFHRGIVALSGNALLLGLYDAVLPTIRAATLDRITEDADVPDTACAHADLLAAIERGDAAAAIAATLANLDSISSPLRETG
ncbi:FadR/GntR family transcriptional regulator [Sciscionella sediminilitoris]|uniref:FadR/GntR family transcriptional regulator n=1 Tax=Sciscionella sediminilitoris TaxID=1445613 RepID=UPI0009E6D5A3|nr:GntR family transcriptional regulator [Sciscionella sp. SE31]